MSKLPDIFSSDKNDTTQSSEQSDDEESEEAGFYNLITTKLKIVYVFFITVIFPKVNSFLSLLSINISTLKLSNEKGSLNYYFDMFFVGVFTILYKLYVFLTQKTRIIYGKLTRQEVTIDRDYPAHWGLISFDNFNEVKSLLNELNYPITIDIWVARVISIGLFLATSLTVLGYWIGTVLSEVLVEIPFNLSGIPLWIRIWAEQNVFLLVVVPFMTIMFFFGIAFSYFSFKQWVSYRVREKTRRIKNIYPQGVKYQYSLAESDASVKDIIYLTAQQVNNYGEFANEMRYIVQYVEIDNMNLGDAVEKRANETRSKDVEQLLKQYAVVLESGSDPTRILRNRYKRSKEIKEESQERIMEFQDLIVEGLLNITAGIIFFLIIAMIMSLLGAELDTVSALLVYGGIPALGVIIITLLRYAKQQTKIIDVEIPKKYQYNPHEYSRPKEIQKELTQIPEREIHNSNLQSREHIISRKFVYYYRYVSKLLFSPFTQMKNNPLVSLFISIPVAILYVVYISGPVPLEIAELSVTIPVPFTIESLQPQPITAWITQIGIPLFIILIPPAIFGDLKTRKQDKIFSGLSTMMVALQQSSNTGQTIEESLQEQGANLNKDLQEVLRKTKNSINWFGDTEEAIINMNNDVKLPEFTRTSTMMIDSLSISGDITETLDVAAEDLERSNQLKESARASGTASIVMLFFVYALVGGILLVMLYMFFPIMSAAFPDGGTAELGFGGAFKIDYYSVIMVSALYNLSIVLGLIGGLFRSNNVLSGIKYSLGLTILTAITLIVFEYDVMSMIG